MCGGRGGGREGPPDFGNESYAACGGPAFSIGCPALLVLEFGSVENESPIALPWGGPSVSYLPSAWSQCLQHRRSPLPVPREFVELVCVWWWWFYFIEALLIYNVVLLSAVQTHVCVCVCVCVSIFSIVQLFYEVIRKHCSGRAGREHLRTHGWAGNKHHGPVISQDPDGGSVQEQLRWLPHTIESNWGGSPHTIEVCRSSWGGSLTLLRAVEVDHLTNWGGWPQRVLSCLQEKAVNQLLWLLSREWRNLAFVLEEFRVLPNEMNVVESES